MKRAFFIFTVIAFMLLGVQELKAQNSINKIEIELSRDSLTNLQRKAIVSEFYVGWAVNQSGQIDTSGQFIYIYCNVVILDTKGNIIPSMTQRKTIQIKQGTTEFDNWFSMFDNNFKIAVTNEMNEHKDMLEKKELSIF